MLHCHIARVARLPPPPPAVYTCGQATADVITKILCSNGSTIITVVSLRTGLVGYKTKLRGFLIIVSHLLALNGLNILAELSRL